MLEPFICICNVEEAKSPGSEVILLPIGSPSREVQFSLWSNRSLHEGKMSVGLGEWITT